MLSDSITGAFNSIFQNVYSGTDATVTGRNAIDSGANGGVGGGNAPAFSEPLLARIQHLPNVREAVGDVSGSVQLIAHGKVVSFGGAPTLGSSVHPSASQFSALRLVSGRWPGPSEVVIDTNTAA